MHKPWKLKAKVAFIGVLLLSLSLVSIGLMLWMTRQLEGGAAAVNEAGRLRMQTWRMAQALAQPEPQGLAELAQQFERSIDLLQRGDPSRPLFLPYNDASAAEFGVVQERWQRLRGLWLSGAATPADQVARQAADFVGRIEALVAAIEAQLARWTAILNLFQLMLTGLALAASVALLYATHVLVFDPLARLQRGIQRVEEGDFTAHVNGVSSDEFGEVAAGFNRMTETLQGLYQNLEAKVREKTLSLETKRQWLAALYETSIFVAQAGTLDELARGFVPQVRRVAKADAALLRWADEANQRYVMLASDCLPQAMIDAEHCIPTGDCLCGQPQAQARTRVIPILANTPLEHCARAGYDSVVSVPVRLHERVLGEIDLFYRSEPRLDDDEKDQLDALAAHLAGAMEALRVGALEREAAVAEERSLLARELHDSIAQSLAFLKIQVQLLRDAMRKGDAAATERVIGELDAGVKESTADVRELLMHFRTRTNTENITPALQTTLRKFEHQTGLATHLQIDGQGLPLAPDVQIQVLHVVQEALSNVRKHARAAQVWIHVHQAPDWRVEVRDDGHGFAEGEVEPDETHVGLRIMRERALAIGAAVAVSSAPGQGTRVVLTLPRARAERAAVAA